MRLFRSFSCVVGLVVLWAPAAFGVQQPAEVRGVELAYETLGSLLVEDALGGESGMVLVRLGEGFEVILEPQRVESTVIDTRVVSGRLVGGEVGEDTGLGWFVVAFADDGVEGSLWTRDGVWTVRGGGRVEGGGRSAVLFTQTDHDGENCSGGFVPGAGEVEGGVGFDFGSVDGVGHQAAGQDPADQVRVLILYDAVAEGSVGSMSAYVSAMVGSANFAYLNSGVAPLNLVIAGVELIEVPTTNDDSLILRQLTNRYDTVSDEAHALRDAYDADLVAQLVDIPSFCGRAWIRPDLAPYGFSVSDVDCALSNLTFAHELGHNFGCAHDPDNAGSSYEPYGFGHRWNSNQWRSVMAYSPGTRVPQFSNPLIDYDGGTTGIADERDNARLINLTDDLIANHRIGDGLGIDCDNDLIPDRVQIAENPGLDLDKDARLDACQIIEDPALDCDADGVLDTEQVRPRVHEIIGQVGSFGTGVPVSMSTGPLAVPSTDVEITVSAVGDLGFSGELITLNFNDGVFVFDAFAEGAVDCYAPGLRIVQMVDRDTFELIAANGIELLITSSTTINPLLCSAPMLIVEANYRTYNPVEDSDMNGVLDVCQSDCGADLNSDGELDFFDVSVFLGLFGNQDPIADWNGDGFWDFFDVSGFLQAFMAGCP